MVKEELPAPRAGETVGSLECGTSLAEMEHLVPPPTRAWGAASAEPMKTTSSSTSVQSVYALREALAADIVTSGEHMETFASPFEDPHYNSEKSNTRNLSVPLVYCDQTASNRPVQSIESYMQRTCLPLYGNTHTNTSITGSQSTAFVAEARQIVAEATNAKVTGKASLDVVLFAGNGCTSAVQLLLDCLGLRHANITDARPVVFIGPHEHHSNLLPWREAGCEIVMVPECPNTQTVDIVALDRLLQDKKHKNRLKMGTFTAASNVTGAIAPVNEIAATLHRHNALAFFDYATAAPYMAMNMNPPPSEEYPSPSLIAKDAIFFSPHKMLGGVGTPGVLVIKKKLVQQVNPPTRSGGGTVFYVTSLHHRFLSNRVERYEGGTPNVLGILRTGLTFLLKRNAEQQYARLYYIQQQQQQQQQEKRRVDLDKALPPTLLEFDYGTHRHVVERLQLTAPNLIMLGVSEPSSTSSKRQHLPIFSFLIRCGRRFLHYNYVCAILNDIFGIQSRGGCQCAGPYSQRLLGLTTRTPDGVDVPNERNRQIEHALLHHKERAELLRPGFTRLSLPFKGMRSQEVDYVVKALEWVAKHGWLLMCQYRCNHRTGEWRHQSRQGKPLGRTERKWLSHYDAFKPILPTASSALGSQMAPLLAQALENANAVLEHAKSDRQSIQQALKMNEAGVSLGDDEDDSTERLRWYTYPKECAVWMTQGLREPPEMDTPDVLGALHPCSSVDHTIANVLDKGAVESNENPAQKLSSSELSAAVVVEKTNGAPTKAETRLHGPHSDVLFTFHDGNYMGEAPLEEIESGFQDGELSDQCEVFDVPSDTWVQVKKFLEARRNPRYVTQIDSSADRASSTASLTTNGTVTTTFPQTNSLETDISPPLIKQAVSATAQNYDDRKKPSRDSSTWGRSSVVTAAVAGVATTAATLRGSNCKGAISAVPPAPVSTAPLAVPICNKRKRGRGIRPPPKMMRLITQAMVQWNMVEEGDRLLLGLSGGKDSLSLLHCLLEFQRKLPINFDIEICTIDPMTPSFDPSPLIPYVEALGLKYHYIRDDIVSRASSSGKDSKMVSSLCAFCARMKRGNLYTCARRNRCNKLVLAQHLDDCAESFLMSVMHNGFLRTMKANYRINSGDLSVIRPMVYCRESLMTEFAKEANLPVINENCPACFEEPKERARVKKLLSREETMYPNVYDNIRHSLIPLMHDDATSILRCYTEEALSKSRRENQKKQHGRKPKRSKENDENQDTTVNTNNGVETIEEDASRDSKRLKTPLSEATDEDLVMELARRKAEKFRLAGAMKRLDEVDDDGPPDPTGQVCTLKGGNGSIPCRELME